MLPACVPSVGSSLEHRLWVVWISLLCARHVSDAGLLSLAAFGNNELAQEYLKLVHFFTGIQEWGACSVALLILRGHGTQEVNAHVLVGLTWGLSTGAEGWEESAGPPPSPCPAAPRGARAWLGAEAPEMVMSG